MIRRIKRWVNVSLPRAMLATLLIFLCLFMLWLQVRAWYLDTLIQAERRQTFSLLVPYGSAISASVAHHISDAMAEQSFAMGVSRAQGQEAGTETDDTASTRVPFAPEPRNPVMALSGPVELSADGRDLFATATASENGKDWYMVSVVIRSASIVEECGLASFGRGYDIFVRDEQGHYLYGGANVTDAPVIRPVVVGSRVWELGGAPRGGWGALSATQFTLYQTGTLALVVAVVVATYRQFRREASLADLVADQFRELSLAREHDRVLFQDHASALLVVDGGEHIVAANDAAASLYNCRREDLLAKSVADLQCVGPCSDETTSAVWTGVAAPELHWQQRSGGEAFLAELRAVPIDYGGVSCLLVSVEDITERQAADRALRSRDAILEAVGYVAESLLGPGPWEASVHAALEHLGRAAGVSRAYIFACHCDGAGRLVASQLDEWVAPGIVSQLNNADMQEFAGVEAGFSRWEQMLSTGQVIHGNVTDLPSSEQVVLLAQQVVSLIVVPIFVAGSFWGFVGFDECHEPREWSAAETDALRTAARTLGASLERRRAEDALRASEARFRTVLDISNDAIYQLDVASHICEYMSPSITALTGFQVDEILTAEWSGFGDRIHPDDREATRAYFRRLLDEAHEGDRTWCAVFRWLHKDGTYHWLSETYNLVRDVDGKPKSIVGTLRDVTEEKQAQQALRESEYLFRSLVETMDEGVGVEDSEGVFVYANNRLGEILGLARTEIVGRHNGAILRRPDVISVSGEPTCDAMGRLEPFEMTWSLRGNRRINTWLSLKEIYDSAGRYKGRFGVVTDITKRKQAEALLHEHNERLRLLAQTATHLAELPLIEDPYQVIATHLTELCDAALVMVSRYDPDAGTMANMAVVHGKDSGRTGQEVPEGPQQSWPFVLDADAMARLLSSRLYVPDPSRLPEAGRVLLGYDPAARPPEPEPGTLHALGLARGGELIGAVCILTKQGSAEPSAALVEAFGHQATVFLLRQRVEAALRESEMRYRSLFENIGAAFFLLDEQRHIVDYRDGRPPVFGLGPGVVCGLALLEALPTLVLSEDVVAILDDVLRTGSTRRGLDATFQDDGCADCPSLALSLVAYGVQINGRRHVALLVEDISAAKQLEQDARQADRLESMARMASGIAHDFGNLLAVIRGEGDLLLRLLPPGAPGTDDAQRIVRATDAGASVTRELMAFSRGERLEPDIVHLNRAVSDAVGLLSQVLGEHVVLTLDLFERPIFFWGDLGQLDRVLLNLAVNARDAMPQGGTLTLRTRLVLLEEADAQAVSLPAGTYALLTVSDTGCGIPSDVRARIFEPFFTTRRLGHRTGLGLSVVYGIVQQHGGGVRVESQAGRGSTFYIYLPAVDTGCLDEESGAGSAALDAK
ncbi:MAG: PAS domain S-box protein [Anaerolineae bacterium]